MSCLELSDLVSSFKGFFKFYSSEILIIKSFKFELFETCISYKSLIISSKIQIKYNFNLFKNNNTPNPLYLTSDVLTMQVEHVLEKCV